MGKNIQKDLTKPDKDHKKYRYLTPRDKVREGDEEWILNHDTEDGEEWGWYPVSVLNIGEHFQKGLDTCIRRKRVKNIKSRKIKK